MYRTYNWMRPCWIQRSRRAACATSLNSGWNRPCRNGSRGVVCRLPGAGKYPSGGRTRRLASWRSWKERVMPWAKEEAVYCIRAVGAA